MTDAGPRVRLLCTRVEGHAEAERFIVFVLHPTEGAVLKRSLPLVESDARVELRALGVEPAEVDVRVSDAKTFRTSPPDDDWDLPFWNR